VLQRVLQYVLQCVLQCVLQRDVLQCVLINSAAAGECQGEEEGGRGKLGLETKHCAGISRGEGLRGQEVLPGAGEHKVQNYFGSEAEDVVCDLREFRARFAPLYRFGMLQVSTCVKQEREKERERERDKERKREIKRERERWAPSRVYMRVYVYAYIHIYECT